MLDLHRLRLLRELAHRGTLSAVAEALSYSPSTVSQQLSLLASEAGAVLLEPQGRRVRLTPQAEVLVAHAEILLEQLERAEADLAASRAEAAGTVRVAAFQSAALTILPDALTLVREQHPALRVELVQREPEVALPALAAGDHDLVVAEEYPGRPLARVEHLRRRPLMADELLVVTPRAWSARALPRLADRPWAMEPEGSAARDWATARCREAGYEPDVRFETEDLQVLLRLVEAGLAAALLPALAGTGARAGVVHRRLPDRPVRQVLTVVRSGTAGHPALQAVTAALERSVRERHPASR